MSRQEFFIDYVRFNYSKCVDGVKLSGLALLKAFQDDFRFLYEENYHGKKAYNWNHFDNTDFFDDGILVFYDDDPETEYSSKHPKDINVCVPGTACKWFWHRLGCKTVADICKFLEPYKVTRLDLAFDDYSKTFSAQDYRDWHAAGRIRSRCSRITSSGESHLPSDLESDSVTSITRGKSCTFYLGSRRCNRMLRIYNKFWESRNDPEPIDSVRYEYELHKDYADAVCKIIAQGCFSFKDLLLDHFQVIDDTNDRKFRCDVDEEWMSFLDHCLTNQIGSYLPVMGKKGLSYAIAESWFERCCLRVAGAVYLRNGESYLLDKLRKFISEHEPDVMTLACTEGWKPYRGYELFERSNVR